MAAILLYLHLLAGRLAVFSKIIEHFAQGAIAASALQRRTLAGRAGHLLVPPLLPNQYGYVADLITGTVLDHLNMEFVGFLPSHVLLVNDIVALTYEQDRQPLGLISMASLQFACDYWRFPPGVALR